MDLENGNITSPNPWAGGFGITVTLVIYIAWNAAQISWIDDGENGRGAEEEFEGRLVVAEGHAPPGGGRAMGSENGQMVENRGGDLYNFFHRGKAPI